MPDLLRLQVLTPEKTLLDVDAVRNVRLLLADGAWLSVYPGHAPLLAEVVAGPVSYVTASGADEIALAESVLHIDGGAVTVFTGGLADVPSTLQAASSDEEGEVLEFDRLAQVLLMTLSAHPEGVLENDSEGVRFGFRENSPPAKGITLPSMEFILILKHTLARSRERGCLAAHRAGGGFGERLFDYADGGELAS